ncbi:hypothetical protein [Dactylosporangium sp. CS-033363]
MRANRDPSVLAVLRAAAIGFVIGGLGIMLVFFAMGWLFTLVFPDLGHAD